MLRQSGSEVPRAAPNRRGASGQAWASSIGASGRRSPAAQHFGLSAGARVLGIYFVETRDPGCLRRDRARREPPFVSSGGGRWRATCRSHRSAGRDTTAQLVRAARSPDGTQSSSMRRCDARRDMVITRCPRLRRAVASLRGRVVTDEHRCLGVRPRAWAEPAGRSGRARRRSHARDAVRRIFLHRGGGMIVATAVTMQIEDPVARTQHARRSPRAAHACASRCAIRFSGCSSARSVGADATQMFTTSASFMTPSSASRRRTSAAYAFGGVVLVLQCRARAPARSGSAVRCRSR